MYPAQTVIGQRQTTWQLTLLDAIVEAVTQSSRRQADSGQRLHRYSIASTGETKTLSSVTVGGGIEARTHAYASALEKYVLGTSLGPQILVYDPSTQILDTIFSMPNLWAFIHRVAVHGQTAYTILSSVSPIRGFEGILTVDLTTKSSKIIPFSEFSNQIWMI